MERDIIILVSDCRDYTTITLNGEIIDTLYNHWDAMFALPSLFEKIGSYCPAPLVLNLVLSGYDFGVGETEAFFEGVDGKEDILFTPKELEIADITKRVDKIIDMVKERIAIRANEIDKWYQEM